MDMILNYLREEMKKSLTPSRFQHTLGVSYTAANLAMRYKVDMNDALIAGLLHDNAKYVTDAELIQVCEKNGLTISAIERKNPYLLHSKVGAVRAKNLYGIKNEDILNAITYHTTGRPGMTNLEKLIFVADYIEPNRRIIPNLELIRNEAYVDLDKTVYLILANTLSYLMNTKELNSIDQTTIDSYEYYKEIVGPVDTELEKNE